MKEFKEGSKGQPLALSMSDKAGSSKYPRKATELSVQLSQPVEDSQANLMTQSELFKSYSEQNNLYLNLTNNMFWFEFGGSKIGRLYLEGPEAEEYSKWRLIAQYKGEFPCHFTTVFVNGGAQGQQPISEQQNKNVGSWFLLGGMGNNCL
jgi:hypothetical protein